MAFIPTTPDFSLSEISGNEKERKRGDENSHLFDTMLIKPHSGSCCYQISSILLIFLIKAMGGGGSEGCIYFP